MTDLAEYQRLLAIGSGRAALILQGGDARPYREAILHACLHNLTYDQQCEPSREQYLYDLINLSGEPDYFRAQLLAAAPNFTEEQDGNQILGIIRLLAEQGDAETRQCLYDTFATNAATDLPDGAAEIVELDGLAGLLSVAERVMLEPDDWWPGYLVSLVEGREGTEATTRALDKASLGNARVATFVAAARASRAASSQPASQDDDRRSYEEIRRDLLARPANSFSLLNRWARTASDDELRQAAADLLQEKDPQILRGYMMLFRRRPFPLDPAPLIALALDSNTRIANPAIRVLSNFRCPELRGLALQLLAAGRGYGARLLANNFQQGDYAIIEQALTTWQDRDGIHAVGFDLRDLVAAYPTTDAAGALLVSYERGPCSACRSHTVKYLHRLGALPDWVVAECRHDANPNLRAAMARRDVAPETAWTAD